MSRPSRQSKATRRARPSRLRRAGRAVRRVLGVLVVLVLAGICWLLTPAGGSWLSPRLDRVLGQTIGMTLGIEGLDLDLPGSLTCDQLHIRYKGHSFVTATNVAASISLPALLRQTVRVTRVTADAAALVPTIPETVTLFRSPDAPSHPVEKEPFKGLSWSILIEQIDCPQIIAVIWEGGLGKWGAEGLAFTLRDTTISVAGHAVVRHAADTEGELSVDVDLASKRLSVALAADVGTAFMETFHDSLEPFGAARAVVAMDCPFSEIAGRVTADFVDRSQLATTFAVSLGGDLPWAVAGELQAARYTLPEAWSQIALPSLDGSLQWRVSPGRVGITNIVAASAGATATGVATVDWETWLVSGQLATAGTEHYLAALQPRTAGMASNLTADLTFALGKDRPLSLSVAAGGDITLGALAFTTTTARATAQLDADGWRGQASLQQTLVGSLTSDWQFAAASLALTNLVLSHPGGELTGDLAWAVGSQLVEGALHASSTNLGALPKVPAYLGGGASIEALLSVAEGTQQLAATAAFSDLFIKTPTGQFDELVLSGGAALNGGGENWTGGCSGTVTRVLAVTNLVNLATVAGTVSLSNQFPSVTLAMAAQHSNLNITLTGRDHAGASASTNRLCDIEVISTMKGELPLAALNAVPQLIDHSFGGTLGLTASYAGRLGDFMPTGTLHIAEGEYDHIAGISLKQIEATLQLARDGATLEQARGYSGSRASCTASGAVQWAESSAEGLATQLDVTLDRLPFVNEGIRMLISGDTSLRGAAGKYRIRSRLALDEAALDLDESLARAKPQRAAAPQADRPAGEDPLELLDLKIRAATPAKVVGLGLDSEWYGEMAILKQDGEWSYTGGFKPRRGTYTVFTRPFKIESGEIRLSGTGSVMPVLDIKSEYSRGEVTVMARLYGEATDLDLEFTSIPSMPQDEMLSWVLFGNDSSALTPLQGLKLAQVAAELIGGPSNLGKRNKTTDRLNVDRVELREMSNQQSSTSLVVGKQLSERVYMEFIHEVGGQETNNIYVEYELTPHFTVDTTIGSRANHGIGANLKFDY